MKTIDCKIISNRTCTVQYYFSRINIILILIIFTTFYSNLWAQTPPWIPNPSNQLPIYNTNNGGNGYVGIGTGTARTPITKLQLYMPWNTISYPSYDRLSILLEAGIDESCHAVGELAIAKLPYLFPAPINYSTLATTGDVVLRAGGITGLESGQADCTEDLILTTRNSNGRLRFATTPTLPVIKKDVERMTIKSNGQVGIGTALDYLPNLESYIIGALDINLDYGGSQPPNIEPQKNHHPKIVFIDPKDELQNYLNTPQIRFYKWQAYWFNDGSYNAYPWYIEENTVPSTNGDGPMGALNFKAGLPHDESGQTVYHYRTTLENMFSAMSLLSNGNVGISNENPDARLYVKTAGYGSSATSTALSIFDNNPTTPASLFIVKDNGNIGIAEVDPSSRLVVRGENNYDDKSALNVVNRSSTSLLFVRNDGNIGINTTNPYSRFEIKGTGNTYETAAFAVKNSSDAALFAIKDDGETIIRGQVRISDGNVVVGYLQDHYNARLSVAGKFVAKEIYVLADGWSDFVFKKDYVLPSLNDVENHIKVKGHLPGIPSEKEVKDNGISLGEMNAKLLQKIEELTLYLIDLKKNNEELNNRIQNLENE